MHAFTHLLSENWLSSFSLSNLPRKGISEKYFYKTLNNSTYYQRHHSFHPLVKWVHWPNVLNTEDGVYLYLLRTKQAHCRVIWKGERIHSYFIREKCAWRQKVDNYLHIHFYIHKTALSKSGSRPYLQVLVGLCLFAAKNNRRNLYYGSSFSFRDHRWLCQPSLLCWWKRISFALSISYTPRYWYFAKSLQHNSEKGWYSLRPHSFHHYRNEYLGNLFNSVCG